MTDQLSLLKEITIFVLCYATQGLPLGAFITQDLVLFVLRQLFIICGLTLKDYAILVLLVLELSMEFLFVRAIILSCCIIQVIEVQVNA